AATQVSAPRNLFISASLEDLRGTASHPRDAPSTCPWDPDDPPPAADREAADGLGAAVRFTSAQPMTAAPASAQSRDRVGVRRCTPCVALTVDRVTRSAG